MLELVTFGGLSVHGADGCQIIDLPRHLKQLALLSYLAVEARSVTRDELIGLFWPEATEQNARQSLSQALSGLRNALGADAIVTEGNLTRRLAPDIVWPDTAAFDAAIDTGRWSDVLELYRGEFLRGFLLPNAREFEEWTAQTRERYRRQAGRAAEARAEQLRAAGDTLETARVLERACEIAPERNDLPDAIVEAFADAGQPFAAVEWFERYRRQFEGTFDEPPPPALAARVDQLRAAARGSQALAPPAREPTRKDRVAAVPETGRIPAGTRLSRQPPRGRKWLNAAVLTAVGVASALGGALWLRVGDSAPNEARGPTTMLVRIVNRTPDIGWPHLAESLEETLAARMSNPPRLYVATRPERTDRSLTTRSLLDPATNGMREEADFVVAGTVHQTAERVRIDLRVSDGGTHRTIRTLHVSRLRRDVVAVLDETAEELADTLRPVLGSAIASRMARSRTTSTAAWSQLEHSKALLADGRRFAVRGATAQATVFLEIADSLARRATRADPQWIDARLQRAQVDRARSMLRLASPTPDRSAAADHLADATDILSRAAIRWPDDVRVHELAGMVAYERWFVARERDPTRNFLDEAVESLERAISLDAYAVRPWVTLSNVHAARGEHATSAVAAQRALERDAFAEHTDELQHRLFHAYFELRRDEVAARWCDEINRRAPGRALGAFCELSLQGWSSIRDPDLAAVDSLVGGLDADPPAFAAAMRPRLRMLQAAVAARVGERQIARRLLNDAVAAARRMGDPDAASFHAAALIRLGERDAARTLLDQWTRSSGNRVPVERWFQEFDELDSLEL